MKTVTAYQCDFCNRVSRTKSGIRAHEESCAYNPAKRHCFTCKHLAKKGVTVPVSTPDGAGTAEVLGWFCTHHNVPLHEKPYLIECDTGWRVCDIGGSTDEPPIPYTCWHYEQTEAKP